jgi:predicted  nucleic acid-binding Zn-ribbon protein
LAQISASTGQKLSDLQASFQQQFAAAQAAGASSDAALQSAINSVTSQAQANQAQTQAQFGQVGQQIGALTTGQQSLQDKLTTADQKLADFAAQTGQNFDQVKSQFKQEFDAATAAGKSSDAALQAAIDKVGNTAATNQAATQSQLQNLGVSVTGLQQGQAQLAAGQQAATAETQKQIGNLQQDFAKRVDDLVAQGVSFQNATNQAMLELTAGQQQLGQTIAGVQTGLQQQLAGVQSGLGSQIAGVGQALASQQAATQAAAQQQRFSDLMQGFRATPAVVATPAAPTPDLFLQTKQRKGGFKGPLEQFFSQVAASSYAKPESSFAPQPTEQPMANYFNYGQPNEIDDILSQTSNFAAGGLATPLMAAGGATGTRYRKFAGGGLNSCAPFGQNAS